MTIRSLRMSVSGAVLLLASAGFAPAAAQTADETDAAQTTSAPAPTLFADDPLSEANLARVSGRDGTPTWVSANSSSNAQVGGNSVGDNSATGALQVSDNAFQNVSGISMVNLNTGNNSAINAAMNINVLINQAPASTGAGGM